MKKLSVKFFRKGNKKSGLIIISLLLLFIFSAIALPFNINPFYLIMYFTTIMLFGDLFNIYILFLALSISIWYFFEVNIKFLNKKRVFGILFFIEAAFFLVLTIYGMIVTGHIICYTSIQNFYKLTFWNEFSQIFKTWPLYIGINPKQFGIFFTFLVWVFGGWGFQLFGSLFSIGLMLYAVYIIIYSEYVIVYEKLFFWSKEDKAVKVTKKLSSIDLNEETNEFEMNLSPMEKEKLRIADRVKTNIDTTNYEHLQKIMSSEKARLEELKIKVIKKIKKSKDERILEKPRTIKHNIEELLGESSYSKFVKEAEENKIAKIQEQKQKVEDEIRKQKEDLASSLIKEDLASSFIKEDFIPEIKKTDEKTDEIPLIEEYYNEIFKNSDSFSNSISKTLEQNIEIQDQQEKIIEVIIKNVKNEQTVEEHIKISEEKLNTDEQDFIDLSNDAYGIKEDFKLEKKATVSDKIDMGFLDDVDYEEETEEIDVKPFNWCKPYIGPSTSILTEQNIGSFNNSIIVEEARSKSKKLNSIFKSFSINASVNSFEIGPTITVFKIELEQGIKTTKITNLEDNIKLTLDAEYIRIIAPISGTSFIGIEVPNTIKKPVLFKRVFDQTEESLNSGLLISVGADFSGKAMSFDLTKTPHLIVAGSTGSDKPDAINTILSSLILRYKPQDLQLILVDRKVSEFKSFHGIPHLMSEVITSSSNAKLALKALISEMENRYRKMSELGVKKIGELNEKLISQGKEKVPYIVVLISELADLMMFAGKEVEESIMKITQKASAAGIHMILATQKPSTDIITRNIKSNIPSRISFKVASSIISRNILGQVGAEKLIGMGDMLVSLYGQLPVRGQVAQVSSDEIFDLTSYVKNQCSPFYSIKTEDLISSGFGSSMDINLVNTNDPIYIAAKDIVINYGKVSTSMLQRHLNIGYNKATNIIETLEVEGVISEDKGSKPRDVLVSVGEI